ncbi:hypothetical protein C5167_007932 [Papaver somniferum]|uniref:Pectate lyase n=1 Tax=Papaver somniferum TaxID=3469 RepID=A0A4Y7JT16_PAPSO|nr:pectate lyase-like [Papaver somniferum]RZC64244.1 hypothetical protein C5167_007932 [Papaver somniferum]
MKKNMNSTLLLLFFFSFAAVIPNLQANIGHFDPYVRKQAEDAAEYNRNHAYVQNPIETVNHVNDHVHKVFAGRNSTKIERKLGKYHGPCLATNPIDRCWRCRADWANDRKRLADCVLGFGRHTRGGKRGKFYVVTDPSDNDLVNPKPGTLRYGVIQTQPLWIIFARSMVIRLSEELMIASDKTIDGRGANVHITGGAGLTMQFVRNVIIHGLHIHDIHPGSGGLIRDSLDHYGFRTASDGDGISIFGSSHIWIDHNSMSNCKDGIVDAIMGSTAITISNNHMTDHNEVMLFGASDGYSNDTIMQVTIAFNHFGRGLVQRMPRCRFGFFHVLNNDYTHWLMYAIGGSRNPTIISQGNRFIAPPDTNAKEVTHRVFATEDVWKQWTWRSQNDLMMNGAFFVESGDITPSLPYSKQDMISSKPGTFVTRLTRFAGAINCFVGKPC